MGGAVARALVAEDHPRYRERVVAMLEGWGVSAVAMPDGRRALAALEQEPAFDLLVTDLEMPHSTGFEVIAGWLRLGGRPEAVIMVTGEADARDVIERCATGGIRLIHKAAMLVSFEGAVRDALAWLETQRG